MKFGATSDLFASPLTSWFESEDAAKAGFSMTSGSPAQLADLLLSGELDCALLGPYFSFLHPEFCVLPDVCVCARAEIRSACCYSFLPFVNNQSIASFNADPSSLAHLTIVLAEKFDSHPQHIYGRGDSRLGSLFKLADCAYVEGDAAFGQSAAGIRRFDLALEWTRLAPAAFVQAVWIAAPGSKSASLQETVSYAKEQGLKNIDSIAEKGARRLGICVEECAEYLCAALEFDIGASLSDSLDVFQKKCRAHGLLSK